MPSGPGSAAGTLVWPQLLLWLSNSNAGLPRSLNGVGGTGPTPFVTTCPGGQKILGLEVSAACLAEAHAWEPQFQHTVAATVPILSCHVLALVVS
jgi:hypothetical protein